VLSSHYPGPGAIITASVEIENRGLVGAATDLDGRSLNGWRAIYVDEDGNERIVFADELPALDPGASQRFEIELEQPLDPVRLRVEITPNPDDADRSNDIRECDFGAPPPRDLVCSIVDLGDALERAALLEWRNAASYDEILVYRDGALVTSISGSNEAFVDRDAGVGSHTYELRSSIEVSRSSRVAVSCELPELETFRRGDFDGGGRLDLSDAIALLGYLFLGRAEPACPDAADSDDSGRLDITDAIGVLGYLFLGAPPPPAPGPTDCGADPTGDVLGACESSCR
jgi:hypothetical protein